MRRGWDGTLSPNSKRDEAGKLTPDIEAARRPTEASDDPDTAIAHARSAHDRQDWQQANERWHAVRTRFPDLAVGYEMGLDSLMRTGPREAIEALCAEGVERFPGISRFAMEHAWQAHHGRAWDIALQRWALVEERFPGLGRLGEASTLSSSGRLQEADTLLGHAIRQDPNHRELMVAYAFCARDRGDPNTADDRWRAVRAQFPDFLMGYTFGAWTLRDAGKPAEAEALIAEAFERFPHDRTVALGHGRWAMTREDWSTALERWAIIRERFPSEPAGYVEALACLRAMSYPQQAYAAFLPTIDAFPTDDIGVLLDFAVSCRDMQLWDAAIKVLDKAVARYPDNAALYVALASALSLRGDLDQAMAVCRRAESFAPDDLSVVEKIAQIGYRMTLIALDTEPGQTSDTVAPEISDDDDIRELMLNFESLGEDCVFGYVQRTFSAEPIGLLRWGSLGFRNLLTALDEQFKRITADENNITLEASTEVHIPIGAKEYIATDHSYGIWTHTFFPVSENADLDKMRRDLAKRHNYFARELVDELEAGEKIFVYKDAKTHLSEDDIAALLASLRSYGDAKLLYIRPSQTNSTSYTLTVHDNGLLRATLPMEYLVSHHVRENQPWVDLCRAAMAAA